MSYILQALKRAEADRKAGAAAAPRWRRSTTIIPPRSAWPWIVGGVLVLNALVGVIVLFNRGSSTSPAPVAVERTDAVAEPPRAAPASAVEPPRGSATIAEKPVAPAVDAPRASAPIGEKRVAPGSTSQPRRREARAAASKGPERNPATARPAPPSESTQPLQAAAPATVPPAKSEATARPQPEPRTATTPSPSASSLEETASKFRIEVLVWSDNPKGRMIFVGGTKYVEGQALPSGVVVEQINEDGVVLLHEGQRVRVKAETK